MENKKVVFYCVLNKRLTSKWKKQNCLQKKGESKKITKSEEKRLDWCGQVILVRKKLMNPTK